MDESYLAAEVFPAGVPWTTGSSSPACDTHFMICGILTRRLGHPTTDMLEAMDFLGWRDLEGWTADCLTSVAFDPELVAVMALLDLDDPLLKCLAGSWRTSSGASISIGPPIVTSWWCGESTTPPVSSSLCAGSATPAGSSSSCVGSAMPLGRPRSQIHIRTRARRKSKWTTGGYGALCRCSCSQSEKGTQFHCLKFCLGSAGERTICSHC